MPEQLIDSMQITANNLGAILGLTEKETRITLKEADTNPCITLHTAIKNIVEKYDVQSVISFVRADVNDEDTWTLDYDHLQTEQYHLLGILAAAYNAAIQPELEKIQKCLQETLTKIKDRTKIIVTAIPSYLSQERMFCVNIDVNDISPVQICHNDPDILVQVVSAGLPKVIRKMISQKNKAEKKGEHLDECLPFFISKTRFVLIIDLFFIYAKLITVTVFSKKQLRLV